LTYWHVEITLEGDKRYAADMPKTSPDQQVTNVIQQICGVPYPVFEDSENEYTVINTKKIVHMHIKEVTE
jgi:hypothetical protein